MNSISAHLSASSPLVVPVLGDKEASRRLINDLSKQTNTLAYDIEANAELLILTL